MQDDDELANNSGSEVKSPDELDRIIGSNIQVRF